MKRFQLAAVLAGLLISSGMGCEQDSGDLPAVSVMPKTNIAPGAASPAQSPMSGSSDGSSPAPPPASATPQKRELTVKTDTLGSTVRLLDAESEEVLDTVPLTQGELSAVFEVTHVKPVIVEVYGYGITQRSEPRTVRADGELELNLGLLAAGEFRELIKSATCLVKMPDGGFGSGFLYGDRQTIVTAAHCVAAKNVADLTYTFFPDEDREVTFSGARLFFYDRKQDVALLRLPEPVPDDHFWLWSTEPAKVDSEVLVMGNPGRNGEYDPMYARTCKIAEVRPDEVRLDVEIYPGYSGGPVVLEGTSAVLGVVSYKIIRSSSYKEIGYSFARSGDIAADAYTQWSSLNSDLRDRAITRVEDRYTREFGRDLAHNTAGAYYGDSAVYTVICMSLLEDYMRYMVGKVASFPNASLSQRRILMRKFHKEYLADVAPEIAERVRERVSPKLRAGQFEKDYELIQADESVSEDIKKSLEKARTAYLSLKEAAETIVKEDKGEDRNAEEFQDYIIDLWDDARFYSEEVLEATASR